MIKIGVAGVEAAIANHYLNTVERDQLGIIRLRHYQVEIAEYAVCGWKKQPQRRAIVYEL